MRICIGYWPLIFCFFLIHSLSLSSSLFLPHTPLSSSRSLFFHKWTFLFAYSLHPLFSAVICLYILLAPFSVFSFFEVFCMICTGFFSLCVYVWVRHVKRSFGKHAHIHTLDWIFGMRQWGTDLTHFKSRMIYFPNTTWTGKKWIKNRKNYRLQNWWQTTVLMNIVLGTHTLFVLVYRNQARSTFCIRFVIISNYRVFWFLQSFCMQFYKLYWNPISISQTFFSMITFLLMFFFHFNLMMFFMSLQTIISFICKLFTWNCENYASESSSMWFGLTLSQRESL